VSKASIPILLEKTSVRGRRWVKNVDIILMENIVAMGDGID
jgi:hypothetical protein